jgi:DNA-binding beta-propeller fold protein YncE
MEYTSYALALDPAGQKIYWGDSGASLSTANLDGSNVSTLLTGMSFVAYGLGLDLTNNLAYCADQRGGKIWRVDLGSGQADALVSGLSSPVDVALDLVHGKIYWVEYGSTGSLGCANLDGSGLSHPVSELTYPQGIALDGANGIIYWAEKTAIQRANIDGSNVVLIASLPDALGNMLSRRMAVDTTAAKLYWTDRGTMLIQRIDTNAVNGTPETVLDQLSSPALLAPPLYA